MSEFRSVSQLKDYEKCPLMYKLKRVDKVWEKPAAWLPQGTAVHAAVEAWEKSTRSMSVEQAQAVFSDSYADHINSLTAETPNFEYWFRSGGYRRTVEEDIERRREIGLEQVARCIEYYAKKPKEVPWVTPDGKLAVELPFEVEIGGVVVRGYVDKVEWDDELGEWIVRDLKTGKSPGDDIQLKTYAWAIEKLYGLVVRFGDYFMAGTGKPTISYKLYEVSDDELIERYAQLDAGIRAENFDPNPDPDTCKMCTVNFHCKYRATDNF